MGRIVTLVLVIATYHCHGHYITLPLENNGQIWPQQEYIVHHVVPSYNPVIVQQYPVGVPQHPVPVPHHPDVIPDVLQHPVADDASRETLEDHGDGFLQNVPDISDEQRTVNGDDDQHPEDPDVQIPQVPSYGPTKTPQRPVHVPQIPQRPVHVPQIPQRPVPQTPHHIPRPEPDHHRPAGEEPNILFDGPHEDGSYGFSYSQGDQKRTEKSDSNGNVEGTYSYTGPDGKEVTVTYTAGADKGYIPVGEGLLPPPPAHPQTDGEEGHNSQVPQVPAWIDEDTQQHIPAQVPVKRPSSIPVEEPEEVHKGMPYSYNYDADLSSKTETADDNGHVKGSYSYIDGAGVKRTVTYTVNGDEGFIASGDIHPDPGTPETSQQPRWKGSKVPQEPHHDITPAWKGSQGPHRGDIPRGVKGRPVQPITPPPVLKGGSKGSGWDKYPLGG